MKKSKRFGGSCVVSLQPSLEHQHIPQLRHPITPPAQMLCPYLPNRRRQYPTKMRPAAQLTDSPAPAWRYLGCAQPRSTALPNEPAPPVMRKVLLSEAGRTLLSRQKQGKSATGYALRSIPLLNIKDKEPRQKPAIEYTYPQLLIQNPATRPGSTLDRQGGSIFNSVAFAQQGCAGLQGPDRHRQQTRWHPRARPCTSSAVDRSCPSLTKKVWLAACGWDRQVTMKSTRLSSATRLNGSHRDEHGRRLWALVPLK